MSFIQVYDACSYYTRKLNFEYVSIIYCRINGSGGLMNLHHHSAGMSDYWYVDKTKEIYILDTTIDWGPNPHEHVYLMIYGHNLIEMRCHRNSEKIISITPESIDGVNKHKLKMLFKGVFSPMGEEDASNYPPNYESPIKSIKEQKRELLINLHYKVQAFINVLSAQKKYRDVYTTVQRDDIDYYKTTAENYTRLLTDSYFDKSKKEIQEFLSFLENIDLQKSDTVQLGSIVKLKIFRDTFTSETTYLHLFITKLFPFDDIYTNGIRYLHDFNYININLSDIEGKSEGYIIDNRMEIMEIY